VEVYRFGQCLGWIFLPISTFFSLSFRGVCGAFRDAPHTPFSFGNPNQCIPIFLKMLLLASPPPQIYTRLFYLWKFIDLDSAWVRDLRPYQLFFSLESSCAFKDAPHWRFRCRDPNQCLPNILKMLLLTWPQIYTRVFNLLKSFDLDSAWLRDSRHY